MKANFMQFALTESELSRFWAMVDKSGECWTWTGCYNDCGYGRMFLRNKGRMAHRISFMIVHGYAPGGDMQVCHHCDNPPCIRPDHLFEGTQKENVLNQLLKGRHATADLTPAQVVDIRKWTGNLAAQARKINVHKDIIYQVRSRITYGWVP